MSSGAVAAISFKLFKLIGIHDLDQLCSKRAYQKGNITNVDNYQTSLSSNLKPS